MAVTVPATVDGATRKEIRRLLLSQLGDLVIATATDNGTTTTFIDDITLNGEAGRYAGQHVLFTGGTPDNLGRTAVIDRSSRESVLTFKQTLPAATQEGDEIEITNSHGMGITFDRVHQAINFTIAMARPHCQIPAMEEFPPFDDSEDNNVISLDPDFVAVEQVLYKHPITKKWLPVLPANGPGRDGWWVDRVARQLLITGREARKADGCELRVYGYVRPEPLTDENDVTAIPLEWLTNRAAAHLLLEVVHPISREWSNTGLLYLQEAERLRGTLMPTFGATYQRIR